MSVTQTGTFLGPVDLLTQFRVFITANGWTENLWGDEGVGKRLHIEKTVDGTTFYFNLRAMVNESLPGAVPPTYWTAVLVQGSTGFDAGLGSLEQPGNPPDNLGVACGGCINYFDSVSRGYRFTVSSNAFTISMLDSTENLEHMICTAAPSMFGFYCSGSFFGGFNASTDIYYQRDYLFRISENRLHYGCNTLVDGTWRPMSEYPIFTYYSTRPMFAAERGLITPTTLNDSVNPNKGLPALFPFTVAAGTIYPSYNLAMFDGAEGVKVLNKSYIEDGQIITVGGNDYVVYNSNPSTPDYGFAFQIN